MQLNIFSTTAKRVTKMTSKAKAAIEEKATGPSKKRKPDGNNDKWMTSQLKKAKTHQAAGTDTPSSSLTAASTSSAVPIMSPTLPVASSRRAVVRTEEEEDALYADDTIDIGSEGKPSTSEGEGELEREDETAEDQLSTFNVL
jgi:hypothetical protein